MESNRYDRVTRNLSSGLRIHRVSMERPTAAPASAAFGLLYGAEAGDLPMSAFVDSDRVDRVTRSLSSGLHTHRVPVGRATATAPASAASGLLYAAEAGRFDRRIRNLSSGLHIHRVASEMPAAAAMASAAAEAPPAPRSGYLQDQPA